MSTLGTISPILHLAYGEGAMVHDLAIHLAAKIDAWPDGAGPSYCEETREGMILMTCWDWMTGGSSAKLVARRIEEALETGDEEGDTTV